MLDAVPVKQEIFRVALRYELKFHGGKILRLISQRKTGWNR